MGTKSYRWPFFCIVRQRKRRGVWFHFRELCNNSLLFCASHTIPSVRGTRGAALTSVSFASALYFVTIFHSRRRISYAPNENLCSHPARKKKQPSRTTIDKLKSFPFTSAHPKGIGMCACECLCAVVSRDRSAPSGVSGFVRSNSLQTHTMGRCT